ncbi:MAG: hypothetical protein JNM43_19790 [Planctomycetaceae bacterium]|nr:hypothetical protein [Planctomycetaceae bacterium]
MLLLERQLVLLERHRLEPLVLQLEQHHGLERLMVLVCQNQLLREQLELLVVSLEFQLLAHSQLKLLKSQV